MTLQIEIGDGDACHLHSAHGAGHD
jgi:hypothetical protein